MSPGEFFEFTKNANVSMVDLKFVDLLGAWQHCSYPIDTWDEETFKSGLSFDGSSIRGWQEVNRSDMLAIPNPTTAVIDPFFSKPTVSLIAEIVEPKTHKNCILDPRYVARRSVQYIKETGIADTCYVKPKPEFFIFDEVRYEQNQHTGYYQIDSVEGAWNTARFEEPNLGYKPSFRGGYFPVSPTDTYHDLRGEMVAEMKKIGIVVEAHHHAEATAGQGEIDMQSADMLKMADQFMWYKYIVKNVAKRNSKSVTFMPKPVFGDNGSGMPTQLSLWKDGLPLMGGDNYAGLSDFALYAIGGILKHASAILAFAAPTTNSYRRLVSGTEAPVNLVMSQSNRSAAVRIPVHSEDPKEIQFEFRCPDPTCNVYLAWPAMLMAAIEGIEEKIDPGEPIDCNINEMALEELAKYPKTPSSLGEAIDALEKDHAFLKAGNVFTDDLIHLWIKWKRREELNPLAMRPHPYEFYLYYSS